MHGVDKRASGEEGLGTRSRAEEARQELALTLWASTLLASGEAIGALDIGTFAAIGDMLEGGAAGTSVASSAQAMTVWHHQSSLSRDTDQSSWTPFQDTYSAS